MSLGIAFNGPEGIVLAADSRVTLNSQLQTPHGPIVVLPSTFDSATKLLKVKGHDYVGAVTYGVGAIGQSPRTAHSFLPELEASLSSTRLTVEAFAAELSKFFLAQWTAANMPMPVPGMPPQDMVFLVGGYDENAAYGRVFEIFVPSRPAPREVLPVGQFGAVWGGQREFTDRLLSGFDPRTTGMVREMLKQPFTPTAANQTDPLEIELKTKLQAPIPWPFLPLQDCVDLSIFLIRTTITLQKWTVGIRGVGGAIDVATITRTDGFRSVQQKQILGEER